MMTVTLNQSWHLWVANFGLRRIRPEYGTDICEYTRAVLKGGLLFLFTVAVCTLLTVWVAASLFNIADIIFGDGKLEFYTQLLLFITGLLGTLVGLAFFKEWWDNRPVKDKPAKPPTFAAVAYRKIKSKTCFRIEFQ